MLLLWYSRLPKSLCPPSINCYLNSWFSFVSMCIFCKMFNGYLSHTTRDVSPKHILPSPIINSFYISAAKPGWNWKDQLHPALCNVSNYCAQYATSPNTSCLSKQDISKILALRFFIRSTLAAAILIFGVMKSTDRCWNYHIACLKSMPKIVGKNMFRGLLRPPSASDSQFMTSIDGRLFLGEQFVGQLFRSCLLSTERWCRKMSESPQCALPFSPRDQHCDWFENLAVYCRLQSNGSQKLLNSSSISKWPTGCTKPTVGSLFVRI